MGVEKLIKQLQDKVDKPRLQKALKMLKAERFQLFSETGENEVVGVVKSQTDPDLVYSCRLTKKGAFACCTQNLNACGGLRGKPCKHLMVLLIGLAQGGELDPTTASKWVKSCLGCKPELDKEYMSTILLRYKGAEAGEVDWRPTETLPEDYYAF